MIPLADQAVQIGQISEPLGGDLRVILTTFGP